MAQPTPIRDIDLQFTRTSRITALVGALTLPGLALNPGDPMILGFIVGGIFGLLSCYFLVKRLRTLSELLINQKTTKRQAKFFMQAGFYPRLGMAVGICAFASQVDFLNVYGVGAGLLIPTVITVVDANLALYRYFTANNAVDKI